MAKNKKVILEATPLESVSIGRTDKKKYGWIALLFIFFLFIGVIYFLPDIQKAYREYLYNKAFTLNLLNINKNTTDQEEENNVTNENITSILKINEDTKVTSGDIVFSGINYENNSISFIAENNSEESIDLGEKLYFIRLYNENEVSQKVIKINGSIGSKATKNYIYNIDIVPAKFSISPLEEKDYDLVMLDINDEGLSTLTCKNEHQNIIYTFRNDKLIKVEDSITYVNNDENFSNLLNDYSNYVRLYTNVNGISATLSSSSMRFIYNFSVDYSIYQNKVDNMYYFSNGASPIKVNFEMKAMFFDCE